MKEKIIIIFLGLSVCGYAQDSLQENSKKHELKINTLNILLGLPEITYEYILNDESSIGASLAFSINDPFFDNSYPILFIPYYRIYFGELQGTKLVIDKDALGYFIECNGALFVERNSVNQVNTNQHIYNTYLGGGIGFAIGKKILSTRGWVGELVLGLGRNFINYENIKADVYPRIGITIGKRF